MHRDGVGYFLRSFRRAALPLLALLLIAGTLAAQATGKIEGRVRDQTGTAVTNDPHGHHRSVPSRPGSERSRGTLAELVQRTDRDG